MFENLIIFVNTHSMLAFAFAASFAAAGILEITKGGQKIPVSALVTLINRDKALVIDVRQPKDFDQGHIHGSVNIPLATVLENISLIEHKNLTPVLVCETGMSTSGIAERLRDKKIPVQRLAGGIAEWRAANIPLTQKKQSKGKKTQSSKKRKNN